MDENDNRTSRQGISIVIDNTSDSSALLVALSGGVLTALFFDFLNDFFFTNLPAPWPAALLAFSFLLAILLILLLHFYRRDHARLPALGTAASVMVSVGVLLFAYIDDGSNRTGPAAEPAPPVIDDQVAPAWTATATTAYATTAEAWAHARITFPPDGAWVDAKRVTVRGEVSAIAEGQRLFLLLQAPPRPDGPPPPLYPQQEIRPLPGGAWAARAQYESPGAGYATFVVVTTNEESARLLKNEERLEALPPDVVAVSDAIVVTRRPEPGSRPGEGGAGD